ncbi:dTMP kinase [Streptomyces sp. NPDC046409]|uniref:dTMP kinase n=1 Tax=Streptomyces sp. NPDC046409 TaxID=3156675 RepID=UPI0033CEFD22
MTTKIHLAVDSRCCPLTFANNPGQAGDAPAFPDVMTGIRVPRPVSRPRTTPAAVLADKAHSSRAIRTYRADDTVISDRYLTSTLVMQQLDGVPLKFLLDLNANVLMPELAVILTAAPALIADRISARGPRNRFHLDPTMPGREVLLYEAAAQALMTTRVKVLVVNTGEATPSEAAATIADAIPCSSIASAASPQSTPPQEP